MIISVTYLSDYLYCARKLYLQKVLKIKVPTKAAIIKGSINHVIKDRINKSEKSIISSIKRFLPFENIYELYKNNYKNIFIDTILSNKRRLDRLNIDASELFNKNFPLFLEEARTRATNVFNFIKTNEVYGEGLWENLIPKYLTEVPIKSENLKLRGIIDKIVVYPNKYVPYEIKTGKMPEKGVWPSNKIQLTAYMVMLKERFNVDEGYVYYADHNESRKIIINPFSKQELIKTRDDVVGVLESRNPPSKCNKGRKCFSCDLKNVCERIN